MDPACVLPFSSMVREISMKAEGSTPVVETDLQAYWSAQRADERPAAAARELVQGRKLWLGAVGRKLWLNSGMGRLAAAAPLFSKCSSSAASARREEGGAVPSWR